MTQQQLEAKRGSSSAGGRSTTTGSEESERVGPGKTREAEVLGESQAVCETMPKSLMLPPVRLG